jgi:hypothetical protein
MASRAACALAIPAPDHIAGTPAGIGPVRSWPLLVLALPAAIATWSGRVGIGQMTGSAWSARCPASGIWDTLLLGMAGQVAYHLLAQARTAHAPWPVTTAVSCLPVLVLGLGMGTALARLLNAETRTAAPPHQTGPPPPDRLARHQDQPMPADPIRLAEARAAAARITATGRRVSRRTWRAAGLRGSNAALGLLAATLRSLQQREPETHPGNTT